MNKIVKSTLLAGFGIAAGATFASNASADTTVTIKAGDTLNAIATQHGTTTSDIGAKNNIKDINLIYVGDVLIIPGGVSGTEQNVQIQAPASLTTPVAPVATEQPVATSVAKQETNSTALDSLIARESGGNTSATNGQYYGVGQLSPQARAIYGGNSSDYNDQLKAMKSYIAARYGTAENAWAHSNAYGWY